MKISELIVLPLLRQLFVSQSVFLKEAYCAVASTDFAKQHFIVDSAKKRTRVGPVKETTLSLRRIVILESVYAASASRRIAAKTKVLRKGNQAETTTLTGKDH